MDSLYLFTNQRIRTMNDIQTIQAELRKFNQERDWDQFHNGKDLAIGCPKVSCGESPRQREKV